MNNALKSLDDLEIVSNDLSSQLGFTLTGLVHNEMHFLPAFLAHYRTLGVERFVFIDDRSSDGTSEFLAAQSDVMVLKSSRKYGDKISSQEAEALNLPHRRIELVWRMLLVEKYALDQWSLHLDADEFLDLPSGLKIFDFCSRLSIAEGRAVWSAMIDMYPADTSALQSMADDQTIDFSRDWYFDGCPHLRLRKTKAPKLLHPGSRARLLSKFGMNRRTNPVFAKLASRFGMRPKRYNAIRKPVLLHWNSGDRFLSAHDVSMLGSSKVLLPIRHYKFNGSVQKRILRAQTTGGNSNGGLEYSELGMLLHKMNQTDRSFLWSKTVKYTGFEDFERTGNAQGVS